MNKMRAASVAMTWSELESYANNLSTTFSDTQHFREQGPTNARATYRSFNTTATKEDARVVLYRDNHAWHNYPTMICRSRMPVERNVKEVRRTFSTPPPPPPATPATPPPATPTLTIAEISDEGFPRGC
jgi:hypothetical protein